MLSLLRGAAVVNSQGSTPLHVASDLVYTTSSSCRDVSDLPSSSDALTAQLLPENAAFRGNMQLSKAASGDGCALYLTVKGAVSSTATDFKDAFDVTRSVHQQLTELLTSKGLDNPFDSTSAPESVLTVQQGACTELLAALKAGQDADVLLPRQVETSALDVTKNQDADEDADEDADCVVVLEVSALVPSLGEDAEAFQLLKAVDEKMTTFFSEQESATLSSVNVQLQVAAQGYEASTQTQTLAVKTTETETEASNLTFNAPTYEEALGIFALVGMLLVMMMGVVVQKKRNDQRSRERYDRASRAAQIRRVSIRMSQYDQEENLGDEGEEDSLL
ncbi:hypothetical protein BBO99_00002122 [Phytophthora kernoviae]|uniref:Uncharacterized protein n=2 Tax=Phytophthora kernoviae TaxID=325452 RepID=A0A421F1H5_9STRA|nr:hypothetical protein G195_003937 [Phytophthora kernoviae 00238/432]KAG2521196.1 hypothetical protein JM18_006219 [Phytophthora kernoviae]KAG2521654.1 hypothetical protein JM16_003935 [Phytophthora kernoviae]RLN14786.1 hypothetical protein BBI17_002030 [Phytophthora kernoviae]RLN83453.1 hypothetical protein BBO99_00002122 [Phytophthora kernoviae]